MIGQAEGKKKKESKTKGAEPTVLIQEPLKPLKKERRKSNVLVLSIVLLVVAGIAAGYYIWTNLSAVEEPQPVKKNPVYNTARASIPGEWMIQTEAREEPVVEEAPPSDDTTEGEGTPVETQESPAEEKPVQAAAEQTTPQESKAQPKETQVKTPPVKPDIEKKRPEPERAQTQSVAEQQAKKEEDKTQKTAQPAAEDQGEKPLETPPQETPKTVEEKPAVQPKPPAEIKEGQILAAAELDGKPVPVSTPAPRITRKIRRSLKSSQNLLVNILIDHNGNVEKVKLLKRSSSMEINTLVISTLAKWTYKPGTKNGIRVKTWKSIPITIQQ
jgi:TonB family protein